MTLCYERQELLKNISLLLGISRSPQHFHDAVYPDCTPAADRNVMAWDGSRPV